MLLLGYWFTLKPKKEGRGRKERKFPNKDAGGGLAVFTYSALVRFHLVFLKEQLSGIEALHHDGWPHFRSASWKFRKRIFSFLLRSYWYKSYFHFTAELICSTGI